MKRIVICADDYNIAPGVSKAIRDLVAKGRLNATSVMTIFPGLEHEAKALADTPSPAPIQIGLHLTLSGGFSPLVSPPMVTSDGKLPDMMALLSPLSLFRVSRSSVALEIEAQIGAFERAFGRPPDYVDGHQHCHLMPAIRKTFVQTVAKLAPKAWVRQCAPARKSALISADNKTRVIGTLSLGLERLAKRAGLGVNPSFSGAYEFAGKERFSDLFPRFLDELTDGGVVMVHPGMIDDVLRARDKLVERREEEYSLLASEAFHDAMKGAGATLA
ncbi:MAG: ChbG/HpnK family deacetylase [Rhizobiales bacterium]|nr:ChbG/HpnK family deacetylase [Hyphomicrobiales bacterium]